MHTSILAQRHGPAALAAALVAAGCLAASPGGAADITRTVIGAGGGTATGGAITVRATVGQPVVGAAAGVTMSVGSGWWLPAAGAAAAAPGDLPLPQAFRSYPNHPNPFNPRTTLAFDLPAAEPRLRLRLFDLQGRLVASLVDGSLPAGRHQVVWNGTDDDGRAVASGVYVSVLESSQGRASEKLTLVR
jgi:hypothetical protein